jgi:hypothetical protein
MPALQSIDSIEAIEAIEAEGSLYVFFSIFGPLRMFFTPPHFSTKACIGATPLTCRFFVGPNVRDHPLRRPE